MVLKPKTAGHHWCESKLARRSFLVREFARLPPFSKPAAFRVVFKARCPMATTTDGIPLPRVMGQADATVILALTRPDPGTGAGSDLLNNMGSDCGKHLEGPNRHEARALALLSDS